MVIMILLAIVVPVLGFMIARMENIETNVKPPLRDSIHYGIGGGLGVLGGGSFVLWLVVWLWSISLGTTSTWIDMSFWLGYSIVTAAIGGLVMAITRPRS